MEEFYNQFLIDFNQAETELEKEIKGVPEDDAFVRTSPGSWSIADCVVHISMVEFSVLNIIRKIPDQSSELSKELTILGRTKLKDILLDRTNKVKLPDAFESRMEKLPLKIAYEKLLTIRKLLRDIIYSRNIISPKLIVPHPVLGKMTKIDWLYSVPFHSIRHTEQIREVKRNLVNNF